MFLMSTKMLGDQILIIAHSWSQRGALCMISECRNITPPQDKYLSHFEDDFSNETLKKINHYFTSHFLCEWLPLIYEFYN